MEHQMHIVEARTILFRDYAYDHSATLYGDVSPEFVHLVTQRMGAPTVYSFVQGLDQLATT
jgi:hypothetical protein